MAKDTSAPDSGTALAQRGVPAIPRVLVAWSPTNSSDASLNYAAWLARTTPIRIRVISTLVQPWTTTSLSKLGGKYKKWFKKEAAACAEQVEKALRGAGIAEENWDEEFSILVDGSSKAALLTAAAERFDADFILIGPGAAAPKGRFLAGTTADTLLHSSPIPLGLSPRAAKLSKHGVTRVNFAFVEEPGKNLELSQLPGLESAAAMASRWNVPLRILGFSPSGLLSSPSGSMDVAQALTSHWRETSLALLDVASDFVLDAFPDLEVETDIGSGNGWAGAVDALKWKKGDIMCLDSAPLSPFERVFLGSTTTEFLNHLRVPVIIYPAHTR